jgi:hypothetical protein
MSLEPQFDHKNPGISGVGEGLGALPKGRSKSYNAAGALGVATPGDPGQMGLPR